jgi:hypothetical protein
MIIRIVFIGATAFLLSSSTAASQVRPPQQIVLSEGVMKSIVANKPKTKTPLTAKVGMVRRSSVPAAKSGSAAPTSVGQIGPAPTKKK